MMQSGRGRNERKGDIKKLKIPVLPLGEVRRQVQVETDRQAMRGAGAK
jgi:hypothetical protein